MVERMPAPVQRRSAPVDDGLPNIRVVLVRPRGSANVGAAARAMKNMGVDGLTLVQPAVRRYAAAEAMAVHARDLVRGARRVASLAEAVADCALVVGTTCRGGPYRAAAADPAAIAPLLLEAATHGPVALLFGPEDHGLTNDDLRVCQHLITIDTHGAYASLNLAQAVLLVCYELRRAARAGQRAPRGVTPAPAAAVQRMYQHLQRALLSIGFLHPQNPEHLMFALRGLFGRTGLADHEVRILLGMARQMEWAGRKSVTGDRLPVTGADDLAVKSAAAGPTSRAVDAEGPTVTPDRSPVTRHRSRLSSVRHG
jgi:tRNA/rRNA methyltransferase